MIITELRDQILLIFWPEIEWGAKYKPVHKGRSSVWPETNGTPSRAFSLCRCSRRWGNRVLRRPGMNLQIYSIFLVRTITVKLVIMITSTAISRTPARTLNSPFRCRLMALTFVQIVRKYHWTAHFSAPFVITSLQDWLLCPYFAHAEILQRSRAFSKITCYLVFSLMSFCGCFFLCNYSASFFFATSRARRNAKSRCS